MMIGDDEGEGSGKKVKLAIVPGMFTRSCVSFNNDLLLHTTYLPLATTPCFKKYNASGSITAMKVFTDGFVHVQQRGL